MHGCDWRGLGNAVVGDAFMACSWAEEGGEQRGYRAWWLEPEVEVGQGAAGTLKQQRHSEAARGPQDGVEELAAD